jgi:hypothetical protein
MPAVDSPEPGGPGFGERLGPRDLTHSKATAIRGVGTGKPDLESVQFSYADEATALVRAGVSESFAHLCVEMPRLR